MASGRSNTGAAKPGAPQAAPRAAGRCAWRDPRLRQPPARARRRRPHTASGSEPQRGLCFGFQLTALTQLHTLGSPDGLCALSPPEITDQHRCKGQALRGDCSPSRCHGRAKFEERALPREGDHPQTPASSPGSRRHPGESLLGSGAVGAGARRERDRGFLPGPGCVGQGPRDR